MNKLEFIKMQGAGNDFIVFEDIKEKYKDLNSLALKLCDRNFGIGGDGILVVRSSSVADIQMVIINADGSYAGMCGNGIRCFAKYVYEKKLVDKKVFFVETGDGIKKCELFLEDENVTGVKINMGLPSFEPSKIPALGEDKIIKKSINIKGKKYEINSLLLGVPHTVVLTKDSEFKVDEGADIEKYELFPSGTNVNFCRIIDDTAIKVDTWERGAGATLACGTGCCSSAVICNKLGLTGKSVKVIAPGGILKVDIEEDGVMMTGPAMNVFEGEITI